MPKYCCLFCPEKDYTEKKLTDSCPKCGRQYNFPLLNYPSLVRDYTIVEARGRGFYAVTYLCHTGRLNKPYILKVSPVSLYKFFGKNFEKECQIHDEVSRGTEHIVPIIDFFDTPIDFGGTTSECHVAVLEYVEGVPLSKYIHSQEILAANSAAQIAIDLFRIWREFQNKLSYHNDLHSENIVIQKLNEDSRRAEAIDGGVRAVAIDLGSVGDASKSDADELRFSDQHWLCRHLQSMVGKLRGSYDNIDNVDDLENRISEAMERTISFMLPAANASRMPTADQLIRIVRDNFYRSSSPWRDPLKLDRFDDSYNAGALEPWYVPFLLVDPDDQWIKRISAAGPLLITGMRGCGKTMLLRALDFHARAALGEDDKVDRVLERIKEDNYVGLFVSCMNLLTVPGRTDTPSALERLFCAYCIETIRAVRHLQELDNSVVVPNYHENIIEAIETHLDLPTVDESWVTDRDLERYLLKISASLKNPDFNCSLKTSHVDAFIALARAVRACTPLWNNSRVFFLLDDLSTRYIKEDLIKTIFSGLIFQSPIGAFKLTSEVQTLEMVLYSPGMVEKARVGRDYDVFDLGGEVYEKTKQKTKLGRKFIENILERRAKYYPNHPKDTPREILGDCTLEDIAKTIALTSATSRERKSAYRGISSLSAVCVGDIGDVISIYELILRKASGEAYPVGAHIQSECYQNFCSRRLYDLNRRESDLKDFALTFAEASYELLVKSSREITYAKRKRLRQYTSIYVRVTTGDTTKQFQRLRDLIDAGVFILHRGTPRTKTKDADPVHQFKLTYRKLFGLSNFMGLAESDRFELSGENLEEWLFHPDNGKEILLRNLGGSEAHIKEEPSLENPNNKIDDSLIEEPKQLSLFSAPVTVVGEVFQENEHGDYFADCDFADRLEVQQIDKAQLAKADVETLILGLGFEERGLKSIERLLEITNPSKAILIEYIDPGFGAKIESLVSNKVKEIIKVKYKDVLDYGLPIQTSPTLVDVSALTKPALFKGVRQALIKNEQVFVCHTRAKEYFPLNEEIEKIIKENHSHNQYQRLEAITQFLTGEEGPYTIDGLIESDADESRRKVLCTFASAKHQRLMTFLDMRNYDRIEMVVPPEGTPRSKIANIAAEIAGWNFRASGTSEIKTNDLAATIDFLNSQYRHWYVDKGYNMEVALTGSKIQAVASALISVVCKLSHCWHVSPQELDHKRYTKGVSESRFYSIKRK